jgi:hypothetical protein
MADDVLARRLVTPPVAGAAKKADRSITVGAAVATTLSWRNDSVVVFRRTCGSCLLIVLEERLIPSTQRAEIQPPDGALW